MKEKKQKLADICKKIPKERKEIAKKLIEDIAFMEDTLGKLREIVDADGGVELFEQGKQKFMRESPALKSYNNTLKQRNATYTQLLSLIPKESAREQENDGFDEFTNERDNE